MRAIYDWLTWLAFLAALAADVAIVRPTKNLIRKARGKPPLPRRNPWR